MKEKRYVPLWEQLPDPDEPRLTVEELEMLARSRRETARGELLTLGELRERSGNGYRKEATHL